MGEEYWKMVTKHQDVPEEFKVLKNFDVKSNAVNYRNNDIDVKSKKKVVKNLEASPDHNDIDCMEKKKNMEKGMEDFEPRPNVSVYGNK